MKTAIDRHNFLVASTGTLALLGLEAFADTNTVPPQRLVFLGFSYGFTEEFYATTFGKDYKLKAGLKPLARGDRHVAAELLPLVYAELRKLAAAKMTQEKSGQTLNPTALVHEAYLRLVGDQQFDSRGHFFAAASKAMRRILVEQARRRKSRKHGGAADREAVEPDHVASPTPDDELLALDESLERFSQDYPEHAALVKLRYFAGVSADEAAVALDISPSTADRRWTFAKAWLKRAMM